MSKSPTRLVLVSTLGLALVAVADTGPAGGDDPLFAMARAELQRSWKILGEQPEPPYWMALGIVDRRAVETEATHGSAGTVRRTHDRIGDIDLRVGSPLLDNTHKIRDAGWFSEEGRPVIELPITDSVPRASALNIWRSVDDSYRSAVRRLIKVRTNDTVKVEREDQSPDFSSTDPVVDVRAITPLVVDGADWQGRVRAASDVLLRFPTVFDSNVSFRATDEIKYLLTTDGTSIRQQHTHARVAVWARTVADDGMDLQMYDWVDATSPDGLPDAAVLEEMAVHTAERLTELRDAPLVDPYVGPAILRGQAAAVFFHEVLGHRVEGQRQKDEDEGQTFTDKVGEAVLPSFLSVYDDPTLARIGQTELNGHYLYDDEGVPGQRVTVVERGILRGFLLGRAPIEGFLQSNGHGRRQPGSAPVARQGNLVVQAHQTVPYDELRARLVKLIKQQNKPFGLVFDDISGGFTFTGRVTPNAFNVRPVTVWKVFPDSRPDELVRGVDLIGTPLTTFTRILAASDQVDVFNGVCGAESGWVPVSAAAPDLLISEVEVQRKEKENDRPPLLPPPGAPGSAS